ncbi:hypothetical protein IAT38_006487 [Cryptococcus sp. DSM 104549]
MSIASSSRTVISPLSLSSIGATRGILHRARPPRLPVLNSPHNPKLPLPTSGTSHPVPPNLGTPTPTTSSSPLPDSGLTFHHSPPASSPSYKTGAVPDLLKWLGGESLKLSGEEGAQPMQERTFYGGRVEWSEEVVEKMKEMRLAGKSRQEIGVALNIPREQYRLIQRVAPRSKEAVAEERAEEAEAKLRWGYNKRLVHATRQKRKTYW